MIKSLFSNFLILLNKIKGIEKHCPCIAPLVLLSLGILSAFHTEGRYYDSSLILLLISLSSTAILIRVKGLVFKIAVFVLFFCIGFFITSKTLAKDMDFNLGVSKKTIQASVSSVIATARDYRILIVEDGKAIALNQELPGYGRLIIRDNIIPLHYGDRIAFTGRIRKPTNRGNPGEYDWESDCAGAGIKWLSSTQGRDAVLILSKGSRYTPEAVLFDARAAIYDFLNRNIGIFSRAYLPHLASDQSIDRAKAFLIAIITGDLGRLDAPAKKVFADSGLAHLWSASGAHVAIVAGFAFALAAIITLLFPSLMLRIPRPIFGAVMSAPFVVGYCLLVGGKTPALRSMIMGLVFAGAVLLRKNWISLNNLAIAALIILLINPLSLVTPSFQLSFAAVAGILISVPEISRRLREGRKASSGNAIINKTKKFILIALGASFFATLALIPLLAKYFHALPTYTLPANILAEIFTAPGLALGLAASFVSLVSEPLARILLVPAELCCLFTVGAAQFFSALPYKIIPLPHPDGITLAIAFVLIFAAPMLLKRPRSAVLAGIPIIALVILFTTKALYTSEKNILKVVFMNVGKGDSTLVINTDSSALLIDGGILTPYYDAGTAVVTPTLAYFGIRKLSGVVLSHPEMDHMGGVLSVIKQIPANELFWNPVPVQSKHLQEIFSTSEESDCTILSANSSAKPHETKCDGLHFLNQPCVISERAAHKDVNNASVVLRIQHGKAAFLFTGDLETPGEEKILRNGMDLKSTVLKVGHHGSKSSSSLEFLKAVQPKVAVVSADYPASGGAAAAIVLERLERLGADVYWTGRDGALIMKTDGRKLWVTKTYGLGKRKLVTKEYALNP